MAFAKRILVLVVALILIEVTVAQSGLWTSRTITMYAHESSAILTTYLYFSASPNPCCVGEYVTLSGDLKNYYGLPIENAVLHLYVNETFRMNLITNSSGEFEISGASTVPGSYVIKVVYDGSPLHASSSHTETVRFIKIDTKILFTLSPNPATPGQTVTMLGNLTDTDNNPIGDAPLEVYLKTGAGPWQYMGTIYTNSSGWFKATGKITSAGTYQVGVLYRGSYKYNLSYHIETIVVNP